MKLIIIVSCFAFTLSASAQTEKAPIEKDKVDSVEQVREAKKQIKKSDTKKKENVGASGARSDAGPDETVYVFTHVVTAQASGCWATFYDDDYFGGASLTLMGDRDLADVELDLKPYTLGGSPDSVKVGPKATLQLFGDENFEDLEHELGANGFVSDLSMEPFWENIESVRLTCIE